MTLTERQFEMALELLKLQGKAVFDRAQVVAHLREMDRDQKQQNEDGAAEITWYYESGGLCDLLGIDYEAEVNANDLIEERWSGPYPPWPPPTQ